MAFSMRTWNLAAGCAAALIMLMASAGAAPLESYDVVVTDPEADAMNYLAPGAHVSELPGGATRLSTEKQDITALSFGLDAGNLHVKLNTMAGYPGTSSLMYVVHFTAGGTAYYTCWNVQSAGVTTNYQDVGEDMQLGCTKFGLAGDETQVGPTTRAGGIDAATAGEDIYIRWEVPLADIGGPGVGDSLDAIWAETWNRGLNTDSAPATSPQSDYVWNLADRAPDEGTAMYTLGGSSAGFNLTLTAEPRNQTAQPGQTVQYSVELGAVGNGSGNASLIAQGLPEGVSAVFDAPEVALNGTTNATVLLNVSVPASATNGTYAFTINATAPGNATASLTLGLTVEAAGPGPDEVSDFGGNTTAGNETAAESGGGIPSVGLVGSVGAIVAIATLIARGRRGTNL